MQRRGLQKAIRRRFRTIVVLVLYGAAVLYLKFARGEFVGSVQELYQDVVTFLILAGILAVPLFALYVLYQRRRNKYLATLKDFANAPWLYEKGHLEITGKIEHVFTTDLSRRMQAYWTDVYRRLVASGDHSARYTHQRFLISSPHLRKGEVLLVVHNSRYGTHDLRPDLWVTVSGEYIHRRAPRAGWFKRKLSFYGLLHYTHVPRGAITVHNARPETIPPITAKAHLNPDSAENLVQVGSAGLPTAKRK